MPSCDFMAMHWIYLFILLLSDNLDISRRVCVLGLDMTFPSNRGNQQIHRSASGVAHATSEVLSYFMSLRPYYEGTEDQSCEPAAALSMCYEDVNEQKWTLKKDATNIHRVVKQARLALPAMHCWYIGPEKIRCPSIVGCTMEHIIPKQH